MLILFDISRYIFGTHKFWNCRLSKPQVGTSLIIGAKIMTILTTIKLPQTSMNAEMEQTDAARMRVASTRKALTPVAAIQVSMVTGYHVVI